MTHFSLFLSSAVCKLHHITRRTDNNDNHTLRGSSLISEEDGARVVIHAAGGKRQAYSEALALRSSTLPVTDDLSSSTLAKQGAHVS